MTLLQAIRIINNYRPNQNIVEVVLSEAGKWDDNYNPNPSEFDLAINKIYLSLQK